PALPICRSTTSKMRTRLH
nr:immunoglobulin heavy chain junction region [Mus musculus]